MTKEPIKKLASITMGQSPTGDTYNRNGQGIPLLNGPTEFGEVHPIPTLYTTDSKRVCREGDLIFCVRGSTTGRMNWADQIYSLGRGVCSISGHDGSLTKYVKYAIDLSLDGLLQLTSGGTFPNLSKPDIENFEIPFTERSYKRIATILSAYDDLIENNLRRIQLLEEAARCEYKMMMEEVGDNLDNNLIEDVCETIGGGTPSTKVNEYWQDGTVDWFTPTDFTNNNSVILIKSSKKISEKGLQKSSAKMFPPKTIMMTSRASIGYFGIYNKPACTNQGFINIIPNEEYYRYYMLFNLVERKEEIIANANGATYLEISKGNFRKLNIRIPRNTQILKTFENSVQHKLDLIENLLTQNNQLRQARDILLPRLMSGEIEIL